MWCWQAAGAQRVDAALTALRVVQQQPHVEVELLAIERTTFLPAVGRGASAHHATVQVVNVKPVDNAASYFTVDDAVRAFAAGRLARGSVLHTELPFTSAVVGQRASGYQPIPPAGGGALGATATNFGATPTDLVVNVLPLGPQWVPGVLPELQVHETASHRSGGQTLRTAAVSWVWQTTSGNTWFLRLCAALPTSTVD